MSEAMADAKADAANGTGKVPPESAAAPAQQIPISSLPTTPSLRTPVNRWQAGKRKVLSLVGSPVCLITGITFLLYTLNVVHIIPRTLWSTHKNLFILLQEAVGIAVKMEDGSIMRILNLDSSRNQDIMNVYFHKLFDGKSVVNGLGSGVLYILPEKLDECLEIIKKGRQKGLDYRQMFPKLAYRFLANVFDGVRGSIIANRVGPAERSYAHIDVENPSDLELLVSDDDKNADAGDDATGNDGPSANDPSQVSEDDLPPGFRAIPEGADNEITHNFRDGPMSLVAHDCPIFFCWDATLKLKVRVEEERAIEEEKALVARAGKGEASQAVRRNFAPLSDREWALYHKLWDALGDLFEPQTQEAKDRLEAAVQKALFEGRTRKSPRLAALKTEAAIKSAPLAPVPLRVTQSAGPVAASLRASPLSGALPAEPVAASSSHRSEKRPAPPVDSDAKEPKLKKKRVLDASRG
ncbi:uncharacterized protein SCHCODRAFT_02683542 [Schizophyllum commune H4-8]|uniref:Uncharacterized protein n=1 Tax=Schizophyllum commune (strain H4-8 / FGSC 9210) TaxID=578458 RepID=D8PUD7_SCHCM|nr:uncharacterized protein SCHCODRAFT_02683542 [Schizophyllum commune H4-8]KAI5900715.1 hypothetical protein SCHCODRAFT_02683542 [Schizophyllum commune H4-8]